MRAGNVNHVTFLAILSHFDVETLDFTLEVVPEKIFTTSFKRSRKNLKVEKSSQTLQTMRQGPIYQTRIDLCNLEVKR